MFGRSPQPFIPPIPPDQTSSSESSPILRGGMGLPGDPHHPPGGQYHNPAFNEYGDYNDLKEDINAMIMQRWANPRRPSGQGGASAPPAHRPDPRGGGGGGGPPAMMSRQYAAYGYAAAPPATPGPQYGYGYSPYPQPSPYAYPQPGAGFPFGAYGGQGMMPPQAYMTPYMTPLPTPGVLDPPAPSGHPPAGLIGGGFGRPGAAEAETAIGKWFPGTDCQLSSSSLTHPPTLISHFRCSRPRPVMFYRCSSPSDGASSPAPHHP